MTRAGGTATPTRRSRVGGTPYAIACRSATPAAANSAFPPFVDGKLVVTKPTLSVTADDKSRGYGDANPLFTASYSGFKNGETLASSGVTGSPALSTTAIATSAVPGPYPISAAIGTLAAGNYQFSFVSGSRTITS